MDLKTDGSRKFFNNYIFGSEETVTYDEKKMIENYDEKEIDSSTITKHALNDYVCELHCKCFDEFAFIVTKDLETKHHYNHFKFICEYCNENVKKDVENNIIAVCSNLAVYGDHRN